jgi:hypothetical protein
MLIKYRFDADTIKKLDEIAWWEWPFSKIEEAWPLLLSGQVQEFVAKYGHEKPPGKME